MLFSDQVSRRKFLKSSALLLGAATVPWSSGASAASNGREAAATGPNWNTEYRSAMCGLIGLSSGAARTGPPECWWSMISVHGLPILLRFAGHLRLKRVTTLHAWI